MVNQPDTVVVNNKQKTAVAIDVAIPADKNIRKKEHEGATGAELEGKF